MPTKDPVKRTAKRARYYARNPEIPILQRARARSKAMGWECDLTRADIVIPVVCPVLGIPLEKGAGAMHPRSPSIDRQDNSLGYIRGNVAIISQRANGLKSNATIDEIRAVLAYMEANQF